MAYFPFFMEMEGRKGLVVGGGRVALRKVRALLPYGPKLTVVAALPLDVFWTMGEVTLLPREFAPADLDGMTFVVAATGDPALNSRICALCRAKGILVNSVDGRAGSSFLFPSLVKQGKLSIGISTSGASPDAAAHLRGEIDRLVPPHMGAILDYLEAQRADLRKNVHDAELRGRIHTALYNACMEKGRPLRKDEWGFVLLSCVEGTEGKT